MRDPADHLPPHFFFDIYLPPHFIMRLLAVPFVIITREKVRAHADAELGFRCVSLILSTSTILLGAFG